MALFSPFGGPILGAPKALRDHLGGDSDFIYTLGKMVFGIKAKSQEKLIAGSSSLFDMYPKTTFEKFQDRDWMK